MTNEEAKKMLEAKLKCLIAETSGTNHDCNMRLCDGCSLNYEQGNMGEQKQALDMAIKALEQQPRWIPVSERLPEPNVAVLTYINTGATETYCLAYWNNMCEAWEEWIGIDLIEKDKGYKVIAWRELPEPY